MNFNTGEIVTLRHFSGKNLHRSVIITSDDYKVSLKPAKEFIIFNYFENDPIVLGYRYNNEVYIGEGTILGLNYRNAVVDIKVNSLQLTEEKREYERFPTSLCAHITCSTDKSIAYIRNISNAGMSVCSRTGYEEGQEIEIEMNLKEHLLSVKAQVIWKQRGINDYEYGIKMVGMDFAKKEILNKYLEGLEAEQENLTRMIKDELGCVCK
jgi:Tfp pilus assembly protein PilZ